MLEKNAAGGSCVALTVISPVYGSSSSASSLPHAGNNGVSAGAGSHYSPFTGMPSSSSLSSSVGVSSPSSSSLTAMAAPPPPPPPPAVTPSRGLHYQPSLRVGITSPQPVGVIYTNLHTSFFLSLSLFLVLFSFSFVREGP